MSLWVVDASPLIFLAKLDRLSLLRSGADEILVPGRVLAEVRAQDDPANEAIDRVSEQWLRSVPWTRESRSRRTESWP